MRVAHILFAALTASVLLALPAHAADRPSRLPTEVYGGAWPAGHVQGIAIDQRKGYMYFSFTNLLVKTDLAGKPIGSVTGFTGHLGDLDFNSRDGRVYGSLEYKAAKSFYIAIFDVDRITSLDMNAETSDVVTAVYLKDVVDDYSADMNGDGVFDGDTAATQDHRYGCSGIDGVAFGPAFGKRGGVDKLTVAYGIYANADRQDNDYQVILQYDIRQWRKYERPLTQTAPHTSGPDKSDGKYFVRTGNTTYGVQNLEYDGFTGNWFMAAYKGIKPTFPNYSFFMIDGSKRPVQGAIEGQPQPEQGATLSLVRRGLHDAATDVWGWEFGGQYGLVSLDDGRYYVSQQGTVVEDGVTKQTARAQLHRWTGQTPAPFERVQ
ncbi:hypothetical protein [Nonomuraea guangzhouensis]|uniref:Uncharacterized protein n=1 Tax=Nonomuraea guangzhouensis TaxID=1291555 RepID=A0ABW4G5C8_9ACTN|nr:hypothetical protein [Nonomuraea guangzhouensis]